MRHNIRERLACSKDKTNGVLGNFVTFQVPLEYNFCLQYNVENCFGDVFMADVLTRAACFVAIILLGFVLRRVGFFREEDFHVLSRITLSITLPASVIYSFSQSPMDFSMLSILFIGLGGSLLYMVVAFLVNLRSDRNKRAFEVLNLPGYNIGLFAMPFIQCFLGPTGVITTSLFDTGNAFVCLGGAFSMASSIKEGNGISLKRIGKTLLTSVPFMCYVVMTILNLLKIQLPEVVVSLADTIRGSNTFLAMFIVGVGFKVTAKNAQIWYIIRILLLRYGLAAVLACLFYFVLPFSLEIRQTLVLLAFSPVSAAVPAFTAEMKGDFGLSSAINSITILCSIVIMTVLMTVMF